MTTLESALQKKLKKKGWLFVPYLALGEPDWQESERLIDVLVKRGADAIELGLPFTDPTADGPVLQHVFERVLQHGFSWEKVFTLLENVRRKHPELPLLIMGYANLFHKKGFRAIFEKLNGAGASGVVIPDVPLEEQQKIRARERLPQDLAWINFVTPTTSPERVRMVATAAQGFIYIVSLKGITGASNFDLKAVLPIMKQIRKVTDVPMLVGFGVRGRDEVNKSVQVADGFIIGTRIHQILDEAQSRGEDLSAVLDRELAEIVKIN